MLKRSKQSKRGGRQKRRTDKRITVCLVAVIAIVVIATVFLIGNYSVKRFERIAYPLEYSDELLICSNAYGLDPCLIAAVINTESGFSPTAVSVDGAVGLMQLLPTTAEWIAWKRGLEYDEGRLTDPAWNMDYGCWLLRYLLDRYDGNTRYALIAYNAGHGRLDEWLADDEYTKDGELVAIPYAETKNYVARIETGIKRYGELYGEILKRKL